MDESESDSDSEADSEADSDLDSDSDELNILLKENDEEELTVEQARLKAAEMQAQMDQAIAQADAKRA